MKWYFYYFGFLFYSLRGNINLIQAYQSKLALEISLSDLNYYIGQTFSQLLLSLGNESFFECHGTSV